MPTYTIKCKENSWEKVKEHLEKTVNKMSLVLGMYMKIQYTEFIDKGEFIFSFEYRAPLQKLIEKGGEATKTAMLGMALDGMKKLNDKFEKEGLEARVVNVD